MMRMDVTSWQSQLRKGAAELVLLSLIGQAECYGLELLERAGGDGGVISDGTLYPLLTRLEREGKILSRWVMSDDAKVPRKYYRLSQEGAAMIVEMKRIWFDFSAFVTALTEGEDDERPAASNRRTLLAGS
jgi:PadR family transcriptional regulator, regulatory protein PadR